MTRSLREVAPAIWKHSCPGAPRWAFVGGVHGDEPEGAEAIRTLVHDFAEICPDLSIELTLAIGNPDALKLGTRGTVESADLNRHFGDMPPTNPATREAARAEVLRRHLEEVNFLVDLHQTHHPIPPLAVLRDSPKHFDLAARAGVGMAVLGAERIYGDTLLADFVNRQGGVAITLETGQAGTTEACDVARSAMDRLLAATPAAKTSLVVYKIEEALLSPGPDLRFSRPLENAMPVLAGEVLGESNQGDLVAPGNGVVFLPREGLPAGEVCLLFARAR